MKRNNILLILTDQQRQDSLGCYGFSGIPTPNLDRLAEEGALFTRCYADNPVCTPSRASLFTGKPLPGHGVYRLNDILPSWEELFTGRLRRLGYHTALIGKLHVSAATFELNRRNAGDGFEIYDWCHEPAIFLDGKYNSYGKWLRECRPLFFERLKREGRALCNVPADCHATRWTADRTIELLRQRDRAAPFCYVMSFFDPHNPYTDAPAEMEPLVNRDALEAAGECAGTVPDAVRREREHSCLGQTDACSVGEIEAMRVGYYASIAFLDQEIGRVLDELNRLGLRDDTLVIFASDHGDMLGDHGLFAKGAFFYEACTRVPLILRHPGRIRAGIRCRSLVQLRDLAATALGAAGLDSSELAALMPDSLDLTALLSGKLPERGQALCLYRRTGICNTGGYFEPGFSATMLREERFKLNVYHNPGARGEGCEGQLFDMQEDPGENRDLWSNPAYREIKYRLLEELMNRLVEWDCRYCGSRGGEGVSVSAQIRSGKE